MAVFRFLNNDLTLTYKLIMRKYKSAVFRFQEVLNLDWFSAAKAAKSNE